MEFFKNALNIVEVILNWSASQPWGKILSKKEAKIKHWEW